MRSLRSIMIKDGSLIIKQVIVQWLGQEFFVVIDCYPFKGLLGRYRVRVHNRRL